MKKRMNFSMFLTMCFALLIFTTMVGFIYTSNTTGSQKKISAKIPHPDISVKMDKKSDKGKPDRTERFNPDRILVKFSPNTTREERYRIAESINGTFKDENKDGKDDRYKHIANGQLAKIELKGNRGGNAAKEVVRSLNQVRGIEYAENDYYVSIESVPNDPYFNEQWGLHNIGQENGTPGADIDATRAWDTTQGGDNVVVGILDTGINYNHEDLAPNVWTNPDEIPGNGIDDDNNGYVDDIHGINLVYGPYGDPMDDNGHGSHCAGIIGAKGNNGKGIAGINWKTKLIGMKFLDEYGGGYISDAITCIDYAIALKNKGVNIRVLSNSYGLWWDSEGFKDAIISTYNAGMLFVAAAGNAAWNIDWDPFYPASYDVPNIISVTATTRDDVLCEFANYGETSVDLAAPGQEIISTTFSNYYDYMSGTSMSTPFVSGAGAMLFSLDNTLTPEEVKDILMNSGDPLDSLQGVTVSGKRLNLKNAVDVVRPPSPGFELSATPMKQTIVAGNTASYTIDVTRVLNFNGNVTLQAVANGGFSGSITFNPNPVPVGSSSVMTVTATADARTDEYNIVITGTSGSISKSILVLLKVWPQDTVTKTYQNNQSYPIYDYDWFGSVIHVPDHLYTLSLSVTVHITHTYIGDLYVYLESPDGYYITLHEGEGGSQDNIYKTYYITDFNEQDAHGDWTLWVEDWGYMDEGTLDYWSMEISGIMIKDKVTISGKVGIPGVNLRYNSPDTKPVMSDSMGNYSFTVPTHWSGIVTPYKKGYTFDPPNRRYYNVLVNQTYNNYTATPAR